MNDDERIEDIYPFTNRYGTTIEVRRWASDAGPQTLWRSGHYYRWLCPQCGGDHVTRHRPHPSSYLRCFGCDREARLDQSRRTNERIRAEQAALKEREAQEYSAFWETTDRAVVQQRLADMIARRALREAELTDGELAIITLRTNRRTLAEVVDVVKGVNRHRAKMQELSAAQKLLAWQPA